jgi:hypothetical protein
VAEGNKKQYFDFHESVRGLLCACDAALAHRDNKLSVPTDSAAVAVAN